MGDGIAAYLKGLVSDFLERKPQYAERYTEPEHPDGYAEEDLSKLVESSLEGRPHLEMRWREGPRGLEGYWVAVSGVPAESAKSSETH